METVKLPIGRSDFADIRKNGYYFVDKSGLIEELLQTHGTQVTLITRPRRFGKTLNMSMLAEFFDIQKDSRELFAGLAVSKREELWEGWGNQYPTLFLSFKSVDGLGFGDAYAQLASVIAETYKEHLYLMESRKVNAFDKELFYKVAAETANLKEIKNSLLKMTKMLAAHYGKPAILLIDEYDVPLAKASEKGYYPQMLDVIKGMVQAVKDNASLKFAIITGCLKIAKESVFTGTNNFVSDTISHTRLDGYFGFTQKEVDKLLLDTGLTGSREVIKKWYDGYRFGGVDIYCPWDVLNYVNELFSDSGAAPKNFWENTSDNSIVGSVLRRTGFDVQDKFEMLLAGGHIREPITENLTYDTLESSEENLWSLLYSTGYLTRKSPEGCLMPGQIDLKIPNAEIMDIFHKSVRAWTAQKQEASDRNELFAALWGGEEEKMTALISDLLFDTISYFDYEESFYHAFLTGLFSGAGFVVESNYENGLGRSDIVVKDRKNRRAAVIEAKWARSEVELEDVCKAALRQIEDRQYARKVGRSGFQKVGRFGIGFWKKRCLVRSGEKKQT